ncbi:MAG: isopenicillin-N epimerase [Bradymonadia bacterium]|jgi:isopenicillin-N epimerase
MFTIRPDLRFLNHGSFGSCPEPVRSRQREVVDALERDPIWFMAGKLEEHLDRSRARLARFLGANAVDLAFVTNATQGVNAVIRSAEFKPGDQILTTDQAYNACANALRFVADRAGAELVVVPIPFPIKSPDQVVEAIVDAVTPRTRLAMIDHITSSTGLVLPIETIVRELEGRGVRVLVDGAHAPGMVPLDLNALGASYYAGNCHKWVCAPKGAAFLHVREDLRDEVRPTSISHGANMEDPNRSRFHLEFDWCGTFDPSPWICIETAIDVMDATYGGWDAIRDGNRQNALAGQALLCESLGIDKPAPAEMIGALAAVPLGNLGEEKSPHKYLPAPLALVLRNKHKIEVPVFPWPAWPDLLLRISMQRYNTLEDVEALCAALKEEGVAR